MFVRDGGAGITPAGPLYQIYNSDSIEDGIYSVDPPVSPSVVDSLDYRVTEFGFSWNPQEYITSCSLYRKILLNTTYRSMIYMFSSKSETFISQPKTVRAVNAWRECFFLQTHTEAHLSGRNGFESQSFTVQICCSCVEI